MLPMFIHGVIQIIVNMTRRSILQVTGGEMRSGARQSAAGKVVLVTDIVGSLTRVCERLLRVWMGLSLEFRNLHAKSLVGLATIHHDMLPLMGLAVHGEWVQCRRLSNGRGSRRRWSIVAKL